MVKSAVLLLFLILLGNAYAKSLPLRAVDIDFDTKTLELTIGNVAADVTIDFGHLLKGEGLYGEIRILQDTVTFHVPQSEIDKVIMKFKDKIGVILRVLKQIEKEAFIRTNAVKDDAASLGSTVLRKVQGTSQAVFKKTGELAIGAKDFVEEKTKHIGHDIVAGTKNFGNSIGGKATDVGRNIAKSFGNFFGK
ncbi:uncharacterized protein LOC126264447 [Aethina tumida]|uniref:uncharacterized protein LOC126264447 n=1 Tax=Aethina tumida TaxID=116153 RepID=UPI002148805D|nr:uncharacterized protein LOC126264447 [Aethina tumida]